MNAEMNDAARIEREVAAEVDILLAVLGAEPGDGPADADEPADTAAVAAEDAAADAALLALVLATGRRDSSATGARPGRPAPAAPAREPGSGRGRRWWYGAAAAAAVTLGLGGALALAPSSPATADPPMLRFAAGDAFALLDADAAAALPSAHDALLALGDAAAATPDPPSGGDVQYVQVDAWYASTGDDGTVIAPVHRDVWLAPDGSVRAQEARYGGFDPSGDVLDVRIPPGVRTAVDELPAGTFDPTLAETASKDPAHVLSAIVGPVSLGGCDGVALSCTTNALENLFRQNVVPSDTRAAIWRALAARSDLRLMGDVTDRLGRHGVGIGFREPADGWSAGGVFVVDPATGTLLGVERVVHMRDQKPRLSEVMAIARSATVAAVGMKP